MENRRGKGGNSDIFYFCELQNHCGWWFQPWIEKMLAPWKESYDNRRQCIKKQRHHFADKGPYIQSYGFSSSHVQIWELNHKEGWALKNWGFPIVELEKTLESPLDWAEGKPVNPKEKQPWIFIGRTDAKAEAPVLWLPDVKSRVIGKDPDARKDRRQKENGAPGWDGYIALLTQRSWI